MKSLIAGAGLMLGLAASAQAQTCQPKVDAANLVKAGTLVMSTNPTLPPMQFVNQQGELKGMRIELGEEIAKRLCLTPEYIRIEFSAMVPGLQAGRWDMINTGIFYTEERAKIMHMILYENQAISLSVAKGNPLNINKPEDIAGRTLGVEIGGFEERKTKELAEELKKKGLKETTIRTFDNFTTAYQALRAGQVEGVITIDATAKEYQDRGDFTRALSGLFPTPVSLAFKNKALADAVTGTLNDMRKDGSYQKLFERYGLAPVAGETFQVKGPTS